MALSSFVVKRGEYAIIFRRRGDLKAEKHLEHMNNPAFSAVRDEYLQS